MSFLHLILLKLLLQISLFVYEFVHWLPRLLFFIPVVSTNFRSTVLVNSSSMAGRLSLMVQGVYKETWLTVCIILNSWYFDNFISIDNLFEKASINNKLSGTLLLSIPLIYDDNLRVMSVAFFAVVFNLTSKKYDNFTFTLWYSVVLYWY